MPKKYNWDKVLDTAWRITKISFAITLVCLLAYGYGTFKPNKWAKEKVNGELETFYLKKIAGLDLREPEFTYSNDIQFVRALHKCIDYINFTTPRMDRVPFEMIIGQAALETGWGTSRFATEGNNLFGHKYRGDDANFLICADDSPTDRFTIYRSRWYSLRAHTKLLYSKYRNRIKGKPTADKWIAALCNGANSEQSRKAVDQGGYVYATSCMNSCYQCKLKRVIDSYDLHRYDY